MIGKRARTLKLAVLRNPKCRACVLHESSVNVCVMSRGSVMAPVMLIGEAPGEKEADTAKPFMGPAGMLLNDILADVGMTDLVYITNICKCRPPGNRKPEAEEAAACTKLYLYEEVRIVRPQIIIALGRTSSDWLLGKNKYQRGIVYDWLGAGVATSAMATFHPSYVRRVGGGKVGFSKIVRKQMTTHLRTAKELLRQL